MEKKTAHKKSSQALLLVDVVNHFEFPDGDKILKNALPLGARLARLKERARRAGVPVIYVNDNFGKWHSDAVKLLAYCLRAGCPGKEFVRQIQPDTEDYCVLKPMHSGFYQTPLDVLLRHLRCRSIVVAGLTTNSCILCTAHDANMRDLDLTIVSRLLCSALVARAYESPRKYQGHGWCAAGDSKLLALQAAIVIHGAHSLPG
jgi:nicotinamidase-related amidase